MITCVTLDFLGNKHWLRYAPATLPTLGLLAPYPELDCIQAAVPQRWFPNPFVGVDRLTNCLLAYNINITQLCVRGIYKGRKPGAAQPLNWQTGGGELLHDAAYLKTNSVLL